MKELEMDDGGYLESEEDEEDCFPPCPILPDGSIPSLKTEEPGGFWVSNEFMDLWGKRLGARGVYIYLWLLRASTRKHYPTVKELAKICRKSEYMVSRLLYKAFVLGALNKADMITLGLPHEKPEDDTEIDIEDC